VKEICLAFVLLLSATPAWAQGDVGPDPTKVRIRMGPLWLNPSIAVTNLGVDNNVFNEETDPKKDFTFTVSPRTDIWLRGGRTWVHGTIVEDLIWYQTYETERAGNGSYSANWLVPLNRLMLESAGCGSMPGSERTSKLTPASTGQKQATAGPPRPRLAKTS
jgi:hypothetical protein